ncbi:hypothetical protein GUITHDRAFT_110291 [Guillardia theta CCMP2712]|uniref:Uncharacterized protein n=1 Tax=Guillardia theta (strain CCMP2712) TaxID=905079 RepID=L1J6W5_GUITC|nr:hypothetical protein GUITHDRAFT_110291 [Guillardia theta CCMP2712]EKX43839.1 hypothetical protein GUITHDRAFT_110291 [Guillardia theta CCMP2712]|eukprot:XP_005830819.1 hypothetical protein GUITHDRAFT_110291 [Guillardia theta CCMP2712]
MGSALSDPTNEGRQELSDQFIETMQHRMAVLKRNRQEHLAGKIREKWQQDRSVWTVETMYKKLREGIDWIDEDRPSVAHGAEGEQVRVSPVLEARKGEKKSKPQAEKPSIVYLQPLEKQNAQAWEEYKYPAGGLGFDHIIRPVEYEKGHKAERDRNEDLFRSKASRTVDAYQRYYERRDVEIAKLYSVHVKTHRVRAGVSDPAEKKKISEFGAQEEEAKVAFHEERSFKDREIERLIEVMR